ncbi:MAG: creatininase family protein [candidate division Zixibacteria bacterium]|nr:creatininase family protein [candidate division Zixibacteria bacterium]
MPLKLEEMNWMEFRELVPKKVNTVLLPVGTIEAHGVTNLGTDVSIPLFICEKIADDLNAIIAPPVYYGITRTLYSYPGSLTVSSPTFESYVTEIMLSLAEKGFSRIVVINGHGGHFDELKNAATRVHNEKKAKVAVIHWWILCEELTKKFFGQTGGHAGLDENAAVLAINPKLVKKARYKKDMVFLRTNGVYALPSPGSILIYKENEGFPEFDQKRAKLYLNKVIKKIKEEVLDLFNRWDKLKD